MFILAFVPAAASTGENSKPVVPTRKPSGSPALPLSAAWYSSSEVYPWLTTGPARRAPCSLVVPSGLAPRSMAASATWGTKSMLASGRRRPRPFVPSRLQSLLSLSLSLARSLPNDTRIGVSGGGATPRTTGEEASPPAGTHTRAVTPGSSKGTRVLPAETTSARTATPRSSVHGEGVTLNTDASAIAESLGRLNGSRAIKRESALQMPRPSRADERLRGRK
eukprot:scaffold93048_cov34-Tisochrysis_lutea.AAC.1